MKINIEDFFKKLIALKESVDALYKEIEEIKWFSEDLKTIYGLSLEDFITQMNHLSDKQNKDNQ